MNKNIKLAVAGAVLALSASAANAGIVIPAGDWTLDINGNVNAFANVTHTKDANTVTYGLAATKPEVGQNNIKGINTGLLPSWLGFTGKTRQNDLDVEFTISFQPQVSDNGFTGDGAVPGKTNSQFLNRQTYLSFGDKSWGSVKLGKDLGVFASDAILNDMTLLGVGAGAGVSGAAGNTTLGGIGSGYLYAAWKGQFAYTTPNFNGFQATVALTNPNQGFGEVSQSRYGYEGKASYSFSQNDVTGKVWVSGITNKVTVDTGEKYSAEAADIGINLNAAGFGLTGYYYAGKGVGTTLVGLGGYENGSKRDSDGGYVQATYVIPNLKTKIGLAYGVSNLDKNAADDDTLLDSNERYTVGIYHPLTKHLNLVAEYNNIRSENHGGEKNTSNTGSLGAILFF